jgi:T5SS/PEP-CTERM-associated repeat protein/autotransporter-associated beta strand protein
MKRLLAGGLALVARAIRFATGADQARHRTAAGQGLRRAPWCALRCSAASDKFVSRSAASLAIVAVVVVGWTAILPLSRAEAQTAWTGATSNDWNTACNWTNGVPTGNVTTIDTTTPHPTVLNSVTGTTGGLLVGGNVGTGTLTIKSGGALTTGGPGLTAIGVLATGTVTVDGGGSTLTNNNSALIVGFGDTGTLTIQNGGTVIGLTSIGQSAGSNGMVTVDGAGSTLTSSDQLVVGFQGTGSLTIANGGTVSAPQQVAIAGFAGSSGMVTVDGAGSTLTIGDQLVVGNGGTGSLTIANGGLASAFVVEIAKNVGSNGMVTVDGAGSTLTSGANSLSVGDMGTGSLTIANGGLVSAPGVVVIANFASSTGTLNIGAAAGAAPAAPGTLNTPLVEFGAGTGTIVFNHTSSNYVFAPQIFNDGAVNVLAGTTILTAANTYTGPTTINGGVLVVDGSIAFSPTTTVNAGGLLAGTGTVGATSVANGGTLSPGHNGFGTLTVNGSLTFAPGATYLFGVSSVSSGFTNVTGTATLTGAIASAQFQGGTTFANKYTILSASGGLGGTEFANFQTNSPAITAKLSYTSTDVILNLISGFTSIGGGLSGTSGLTRNQTAVAAALDNAFNHGGKSLTGLAGLSAGQFPAAFDALSGEGISAAQQTAFGAGNVFTTMMMDQGAFWRGGASADRADPNGVTYAPLGYASEKPAPGPFAAMPAKAPLFEQRWRGWVAGFEGTASLRGEADPGSAGQRERIAAAAAGLDYQVNPNLLVGGAAGGSTSSFSVPDRSTSGNLNGFHLGGYAVARRDQWYAAGTLAFANFDNTTQRSIIGVGPTETANGSFASNLLSGRFEFGWQQVLNGFSVTPFAALQFAELWQRGFAETGTAFGGAPAVNGLSFAGHHVASLPAFLGAQFDTRYALANGMIWSPYARVSWVHEFDPARNVSASFIAMPGSGFTVDGPRAASNAARLDLGSKLALTRTSSLFASFDGEFSDRSQSYAGKGGFKVNW